MSQNRPLQLQGQQDPALTAANMIIDAMLSPPFRWMWNRASLQFQLIDPKGWQATATVIAGYRIIDSNGNMQTVQTPGITGSSVPTWSTTPGGPTTDNTVTWVESYGTDYLQGASSFGFIEQATLTTVANKIYDIPNKTLTLTTNSETGRPQNIAPYLDDNNGNITFRISPGIPDQIYTATVVYQQRAALLTSTGSAWPIPDMFSQIYQTGFLGMIWLFADDPRSQFMLQRFAAMVISVSDGLTDQEKNSFLDQWDVITARRGVPAGRAQQGQGARSAS